MTNNETLKSQVAAMANDIAWIKDAIRELRDIVNGLNKSFVPFRDHDNLKKRVKKIEDGHTWAIRLVVGSVILAALAVFLGIN